MRGSERRLRALEAPLKPRGRFIVVTGPEGTDWEAEARSIGFDPDAAGALLVGINKPEPCAVTVEELPVYGRYEDDLRRIGEGGHAA